MSAFSKMTVITPYAIINGNEIRSLNWVVAHPLRTDRDDEAFINLIYTDGSRQNLCYGKADGIEDMFNSWRELVAGARVSLCFNIPRQHITREILDEIEAKL